MAIAVFIALWIVVLIAFFTMRWKSRSHAGTQHRDIGDPETDLNIRAMIDHIGRN